MLRLPEAQAAFTAALLDPDLRVPENLRSFGEPGDEDRFAVYRNNVMIGLIEALRDAYPIVCRLVGDEFFGAMAGAFARSQPPSSPVMLDYGAGFAGFISAFPPAASVPYLGDVARLERGWVEAYHAAEAEPLESVDDASSGLDLHPATRLVRSRFAILTIWQAHLGHAEPAALELPELGQNVLVVRPHTEVRACCIPDAAADLIEGVAAGVPLASHAEEHLMALVELGAFAEPSPVTFA